MPMPKGFQHSEATKSIMRLKRIGRKPNLGTRKKCPQNCLCGRHQKIDKFWVKGFEKDSEHAIEHAKKMRGNQYAKGNQHTLEGNTRISQGVKIAWKNGSYDPTKISISLMGHPTSEETKAKISIGVKEAWKDPNLRNKMLPHLARIRKPTSIEKILIENLCYIYGPDLVFTEFSILDFHVDAAVPFLKLAFEADGEYWHRNPELDKPRQIQIENVGWQVFRYKESILRKWI